MRYSSALVLGTVAIGQVAAANHRHASFHARRQAEVSKRGAADVDWSKVSLDLSGVNWATVNYNTPTAPTQAPAPVVESPAPVVETSAPVVTPSAPAPKIKDPVPSSPSTPETPKTTKTAPKTSEPTTPTTVGGVVSDLLYGVADIVSSMGLKGAGVNSLTNNGGIWIGTDSAWQTEFTNDGSGDMVIFCWQANGYTGMTLNVNLPAISVGLKKGDSVSVSFAEGVPAACAPAFADTKLSNFGGIDNTWYEVTYGAQGAFDISKNVNMHGNNISAKGSKCKSDMTTCVFECQDSSLASCETGYQLSAMDAPGCGGGYDAAMGGTGGGCSMGATGETVKVTFT